MSPCLYHESLSNPCFHFYTKRNTVQIYRYSDIQKHKWQEWRNSNFRNTEIQLADLAKYKYSNNEIQNTKLKKYNLQLELIENTESPRVTPLSLVQTSDMKKKTVSVLAHFFSFHTNQTQDIDSPFPHWCTLEVYKGEFALYGSKNNVRKWVC